MGHDEGGGTTNKWFFSYMSDGTLGLHINSTGGSGVFLTSPSAAPVATGTWNLFAITRSGSTYTFYKNSTSLGTVNYSTALPAIAAPLTIGQTGEGIGFVNGCLQNVQIFDTALSQSEVAALLVPEPSTLAGCVVALGSLGMYRLRRRRRHAVRAAASWASQPMETTS
ncbi:MAG: LamG domain-containing protein [Pirellulales bacterium]